MSQNVCKNCKSYSVYEGTETMVCHRVKFGEMLKFTKSRDWLSSIKEGKDSVIRYATTPGFSCSKFETK